MAIIQNVFPLPQGVTIVNNLDSTCNYSIDQGGVLCFPFQVQQNQQILVTASQNLFYSSQQFVLIGWASQLPYGISISGQPSSTNATISLSGDHGDTFCYYDVGLPPESIRSAAVQTWVNPNSLYYFNIQNRENRNNSVYVAFEFF